MKELKENIAAIDTYSSADTLNKENFPAWSMSDAMRLEQLAMTGTLGSSFYAAAKETTQEAAALLERADASALAGAIARGRQQGFIRSFPILGLLYLSKKDTALFQATFDQVILTGNDLVDFIDLTRKTRGFGRAVKRAICHWLQTKTTPHYAMKYRRALADAVRISRFRGEDPIYAYILSKYGNVKGVNDDKIEAACQKYPELAADRRFIELIEEKKFEEAADLLIKSQLEIGHLTAFYDQFDKTVWTAVARRTPVMRFLKYLAKFVREGVDLGPVIEQKITVENLRKAKVFPFRLYTAYREACPMTDDVARHLVKVLDDYADKYDWSDFAKYSWVIAPDMSGSMRCQCGSGSLTYAAVSGMFTAFFTKGVNASIMPWNTEVLPYRVPKESSVMTHIDSIADAVGGGTYMDAPVNAMLQQKIRADYSVFITDSMEYGRGWFAAWKEYRKFNPAAQAFIIRLDQYNTSPIPEDEAEKYGVWQIFGWNDSVIEYMRYIIRANGN